MPKNAVQRLHKIENDIKTVISIFDVANKTTAENGKHEKPKDGTKRTVNANSTKNLDNLSVFSQNQNHGQSSMLESFKKQKTFTSHSIQSIQPVKKYWAPQTPCDSTTSSATALSAICESEYLWQPNDAKTNPQGIEKTLDTATLNELIAREKVPSAPLSPSEVFMTPSKTIATANQILANNYYGREESEGVSEKDYCELEVFLSTEQIPNEELCHGDEHKTKNEDTKKEPKEISKTNHIEPAPTPFQLAKLKLTETKNGKPNRSRSLSFNSENTKKIQHRRVSPSPKPLPVLKTSSESKKDQKSQREKSPKMFKTEKPRNKSPDLRSALKAYSESKSPKNKANNFKFLEDTPKSSLKSRPSTANDIVSSKTLLKVNLKGRKDEKFIEKTDANLENEKKTKSALDVPGNLKVQKTSESDCSEEVRNGFSIYTEKLDKMKLSKGLAMNIVKQLTKFEGIRQSKDELLEKLQKVEKDNERLNNEVKDANQSKIKLETQVKDSQSKLLEKDSKNKEIICENARLKCKMIELEKQHSNCILEKERLLERQIDLKKREEEIQKVINENARLIEKIDELRAVVKDNKSKVLLLEDNLSQYQKEVLRQKRHLKQKTERLEDTNNELDIIRRNSEYLEGQVKILRKNIENFDKMHQDLLSRTTKDENEIKIQKEQIEKLLEENAKLKKDLENSKDSLLIKDKIIEDQQNTIKDLREKSEEYKLVLKKNQSLERVLNIEREEKLELQEAVERLKYRKEELKKKVKVLEGDLLVAPQEVVRDLQKTQVVLHELENQVQIKQKEWELHLQSLIREKEQACSVAEFATKKLVQTTNEFKKQSEAHKRLHRVLAENLAEKERHLREATEKVNQSQVNQIMTSLHQDLTKPSSPKSHRWSAEFPDTIPEIPESTEWYDHSAKTPGYLNCFIRKS